jgi:alkylation response protein AidB-like acyl-CoA dehydrogenase
MGRLVGNPEVRPLDRDSADKVRTWLRIACAAEMAGLMQAAVDATVEHLSVRKQFGRPLGTFQALRHRMAECAVLTGGVRRLALKAAWSGDPGDAALAAFHAQDSANRVNYDVHQMMGAMGMTLEMSLHLWTYRMKALLSEQGGRGGQADAVARHCFAD